MKILISRPLPGGAAEFLLGKGYELRVLEEGRSKEKFFEAFCEADGVIPLLSDFLDAKIIESASSLRAISNFAVGFNNIDLRTCTKLGIPVTNTPDVLTDATADLTMTLILMAMRRIPEAMKFLADGKFAGWKPDLLLGKDLRGKNLGIIGMGRIGKALAGRAEAFGMHILYHTKSGSKPEIHYPHVSMETLLAESDVVSLHLPLTDRTHHLLGPTQIAQMKTGAVLVNTCRGPVLDESAVSEALEKGKLFYGGFDVYENEPMVHSNLLKLPNVILLPHIGSATVETRSAMGMTAAKSLDEALSGRRPSTTVNPDVYDTPAWKSREKKQ